jgi:hypothetical protein
MPLQSTIIVQCGLNLVDGDVHVMLFSTSEFCDAEKVLLFYRYKWNYIAACAFKPCVGRVVRSV